MPSITVAFIFDVDWNALAKSSISAFFKWSDIMDGVEKHCNAVRYATSEWKQGKEEKARRWGQWGEQTHGRKYYSWILLDLKKIIFQLVAIMDYNLEDKRERE